jgi:hypothetical protein
LRVAGYWLATKAQPATPNPQLPTRNLEPTIVGGPVAESDLDKYA